MLPRSIHAFIRWSLVVLCIIGMSVGPTAALVDPPDGPHILEIYPNTVTHGNVGEYITVMFPSTTNVSGWTITDGRTNATLPNETIAGPVAFSTDPSITELLTAHPVYGLDGHLALAVDGDTIELRDDEFDLVDVISYENAPRAHRLTRTDAGWAWVATERTTFRFDSHSVDAVTAFVLPDDSSVPISILQQAEHRILLAGYTFSSEPVASELLSAHERGVTVNVLVDGSPVGGQAKPEADILDELADSGISVRVVQGTRGTYRFHHAKYALVDDTALVLTENWKPSGTGGRSSRGWGVAVEEERIATDLADVFMADATGRDVISWQRYRIDRTFVSDRTPRTVYPTEFATNTVDIDQARVIVAPDAAEAEIGSLLAGATHTIQIQQVRIADLHHPFVQALVDAARRGVRVHILLDHTWYVESENVAFARTVDALAKQEDLPIEVRLVEPRSRFEKVHTKGVIIDDRIVVVGSMNWNNVSIRENREVALVLYGADAGSFYASVFRADWRGGRWYVPVEVGVVWLAATLLAAAMARRRIRFDPQ